MLLVCSNAAVLPLFVSRDVWLSQEWLLQGLELWQTSPLGWGRDYFLPLPNLDFAGTCGKKARYSDAQTFSRALLSSLRDEDGEKLLLDEAVGMWKEHLSLIHISEPTRPY